MEYTEYVIRLFWDEEAEVWVATNDALAGRCNYNGEYRSTIYIRRNVWRFKELN